MKHHQRPLPPPPPPAAAAAAAARLRSLLASGERYLHQPSTIPVKSPHTLGGGWRGGCRRGVVVSGVRRMNEVNARRARLVPGWVTVFGRVYHLGM